MNSLMASHLAAMHPDTTFIHMSPGAVGTNILSGLGIPNIVKRGISFAIKPILVPITESGERTCFAATSATFGPKSAKGDGMAIGADGGVGGGAYLLNWKDDVVGNKKVLTPYMEQGVSELVYEHTMGVFEKVCNRGEKW
jgi:hypothetical protein